MKKRIFTFIILTVLIFALSAPVFADADLSVNERGNVSLTFDFDLSNLGYTMVKDGSENFVPYEGADAKKFAVLCLLSDAEISDISIFSQDEIKNMTVFVSGGDLDDSGYGSASFRIPSKSGVYTVVIINPYFDKIYKSFNFESKLYFDYNDALADGEEGVISFIEENAPYIPINYDAFSLISEDEKLKFAKILTEKGEVNNAEDFNALFENLALEDAVFETCADSDVLKYIKAVNAKENSSFSDGISNVFVKKLKEEKQLEIINSLIPSKADSAFRTKFDFAVFKAYTENFEYFASLSEIVEDENNIWGFSGESLETYNGLDNKNAVLSKLFDYVQTAENMDKFREKFASLVSEQKKSEDEKKNENNNSNNSSSGGSSKGSSSKGSSISASLPPVPSDNTPETVVPDTEKTADFADLTGFEWAKDAVDYLYQKGIVSGRNEKEFAPSDYVTREEFVKMVTYAIGLKGADAECSFTDVSADDWFYAPVAAAVRASVISGISKDKFGTGQNITREDSAVIICRALDYQNVKADIKNTAEISDAQDISPYALESVERLLKINLLSGYEDKTFKPKNSLTRAECAVVIRKLLSVSEVER